MRFGIYKRPKKGSRFPQSTLICTVDAADEKAAMRTARANGLCIGRQYHPVKITDEHYARLWLWECPVTMPQQTPTPTGDSNER